MKASVVHRTESGPSRGSELTFVLLGLLSAGRKIETLATRAAVAPGGVEAMEPPHRLVATLLGALSLDRRLRERLEASLVKAARGAETPALASAAAAPRDLLR